MIRATPSDSNNVRAWKPGQQPERTFDQQKRNNSSAGYSLAEALRNNQHLRALARKGKK